MPTGRIVILMGSKSDLEFASRIGAFLEEEGFPVNCEYVIASAHRTPEKVLDELNRREKVGEPIVYITVAGLSDALSGIVAGHTKYPSIACPPDSENYGWTKVFSSVMTPRGVSVAFIPKPENAALAAVKILAFTDSILYEAIGRYQYRMRESVFKDDEALGTTESG